MKTIKFILAILFSITVAACGGGGGTSGQSSPPDATPPTVSAIGPGDGGGTNEPIIVTFSEEMDPATINSTSFLVSGGAIGTVSYDTAAKKAYFTISGNLTPNTPYDVTITSGVKDLAGNAMAGYYQWSFTTGFAAAAGTWQEIPSEGLMLPYLQKAVWSDSELLIFGGFTYARRFNPSNNTWKDMSRTNMPTSRQLHTAVWTGSEMIVWGGTDQTLYLNNGGRYNPATDSWTSMTTTNAPQPRMDHSAVWTGSEMIIWGGNDGLSNINTGGRYNPSTNSWTLVSTVNAPSARINHCAIWTGSEMIIWGGNESTGNINTGGRYNPATNTWIATSTIGAPSSAYTCVWTGTEMITWSSVSNSGGRYNPSTDTWLSIATGGPIGLNYGLIFNGHYSPNISVWTGTEMIVWGGDEYDIIGGRYNPSTDTWLVTSKNGAPPGGTIGVWTGTQMIIVGGFSNTGGMYTP